MCDALLPGVFPRIKSTQEAQGSLCAIDISPKLLGVDKKEGMKNHLN